MKRNCHQPVPTRFSQGRCQTWILLSMGIGLGCSGSTEGPPRVDVPSVDAGEPRQGGSMDASWVESDASTVDDASVDGGSTNCPEGMFYDDSAERCVPGCRLDSHCPAHQYCDPRYGTCRDGCRDDAACPTGFACDLETRRCGESCFDCEDDENECTVEGCVEGECARRAVAYGEACPEEDGNECTAAVCDGLGTCVHEAVLDLTACNETNPCVVYACSAGECIQRGTQPDGVICVESPLTACRGQVCTSALMACRGGDRLILADGRSRTGSSCRCESTTNFSYRIPGTSSRALVDCGLCATLAGTATCFR